MLKLVKIPVWTIILGLIGLIGSLTAYAYSRDTRSIEENTKKIDKIQIEYATKVDLEKAYQYTDDKMIDHEKHHTTLNEEIKEIKESNIRMENKIDKILFKMSEL